MNTFKPQTHVLEHITKILGPVCSLSSIQRTMKAVGLTRKRLSNKVLGQCDETKVREFLEEYDRVKNTITDPLSVSVDECGFSEKCTPLYGYSKKGVRCTMRMKKGNWKHHSLIHAIASDGTEFHQIKEGSVTKSHFADYVLDLPFPPDTIILLDNCSIHKGLDEVFTAKGFIPLFLPPYCPKFQPVELSFSKIKNCFRSLWPWSPKNKNEENTNIIHAIETSIAKETISDRLGFFRQVEREMIASKK